MQVETVKLLVLLLACGFGLLVLLTHFLAKDSTRVRIVGWICLVFALLVFVAPLCIVVSSQNRAEKRKSSFFFIKSSIRLLPFSIFNDPQITNFRFVILCRDKLYEPKVPNTCPCLYQLSSH